MIPDTGAISTILATLAKYELYAEEQKKEEIKRQEVAAKRTKRSNTMTSAEILAELQNSSPSRRSKKPA